MVMVVLVRLLVASDAVLTCLGGHHRLRADVKVEEWRDICTYGEDGMVVKVWQHGRL
jgi:hypothetical protein